MCSKRLFYRQKQPNCSFCSHLAWDRSFGAEIRIVVGFWCKSTDFNRNRPLASLIWCKPALSCQLALLRLFRAFPSRIRLPPPDLQAPGFFGRRPKNPGAWRSVHLRLMDSSVKPCFGEALRKGELMSLRINEPWSRASQSTAKTEEDISRKWSRRTLTES